MIEAIPEKVNPMANTFAPFGFDQYKGTGAAPTFEQVPAAIATANTTPIFSGDPVVQATNATGIGTGYITQYYGSVPLTVGATAIAATAGADPMGKGKVGATAIAASIGTDPEGRGKANAMAIAVGGSGSQWCHRGAPC
jgi:hypothetical protein